ncbi:MAG TPA: 4Fe-4S dicluster-binding protein [archaeon]|nr:4Fe-4S dicluster-binding protein [archaeon]
MEVNLSINFCGVKFPNPFIVSQVPPIGNVEIVASQLQAGWGGVVLRKTSLNATPDKHTIAYQRQRAPLYRGVEYEEKRLTDLGWIEPLTPAPLEETGRAITILKERFPEHVIIASMIGANREEWLKVSRRLHQAGADLIECDFSIALGESPEEREIIAHDLKLMEKAARYIREGARSTPVMLKLPGMIPDRGMVIETLKEAGADALTLFYEPRGVPGINLTNFVPFPNVGGKSSICVMGGAATKPYTLGMLAEWGVANTGLAISALGGAYNWRDSVEFILIGASVLQLHGAVLQRGVGLVDELKSGVSDYLEEKMISSVDKLVGKSLPFFSLSKDLPRNSAVVAAIDEKLCSRCGICYRICEGLGYNAIGISSQRKTSVDKKKCVGDGLCVAACPVAGCMSLRRISR